MSGHDDFITCIALSREGHLIASGQQGNCADVLLWDVDTREVRYRWQEHDHGISCLAFTRDDAIVISVGNVFDKRAFVWDCNSGLILAHHAPSPDPTRNAGADCIQPVAQNMPFYVSGSADLH